MTKVFTTFTAAAALVLAVSTAPKAEESVDTLTPAAGQLDACFAQTAEKHPHSSVNDLRLSCTFQVSAFLDACKTATAAAVAGGYLKAGAEQACGMMVDSKAINALK
jgi:hypothetical protein